MTHICHVLTRYAGWEQRTGQAQLIEGLPSDRYAQTVTTFGGVGPAGWDRLAVPAMVRIHTRDDADLMHAWGVRAGHAARAASAKPVIVEIHDPLEAAREAKVVRALAEERSGGFAVACSCETVRRRLIEGGVSPALCVVIRPGVDFSLLSRGRRDAVREALDIEAGDYVITVPAAVDRKTGAFDAFWAANLLYHCRQRVTFLMVGRSRELTRIARVATTAPGQPMFVDGGDRISFDEAMAASDALVVAPRGDIATTSIAWAMAAGVSVIGTAVHAVAELIAHKLNGLLFKQETGQRMVVAIMKLLRDRTSQAKGVEVARGHAYDVFGLRRRMEQYMQLYGNLLTQAPPGEGITDSALGG